MPHMPTPGSGRSPPRPPVRPPRFAGDMPAEDDARTKADRSGSGSSPDWCAKTAKAVCRLTPLSYGRNVQTDENHVGWHMTLRNIQTRLAVLHHHGEDLVEMEETYRDRDTVPLD